MSTTVNEGGGGGFAPAPEGTHIARCVRVIDIGTQPGSELYPDPKHKVVIGWELPDETIEIDGEHKPRLVQQWYTASLHEKAKLRQHLESWRGKKFTADELAGFDLKNVLGVPAMVSIVHNASGTNANVAGVSKLPKGITCPEAGSALVHYQIEDGESDAFLAMSDRMQEIIRRAQEWGGEKGGATTEADPIPF